MGIAVSFVGEEWWPVPDQLLRDLLNFLADSEVEADATAPKPSHWPYQPPLPRVAECARPRWRPELRTAD
ncbi:MAG TPA: hypothetical protein GYA10_09160 [Alphaproteobacteria bacterium]|nr:hypothetical protein [Alphaproteobacteria bacterium]